MLEAVICDLQGANTREERLGLEVKTADKGGRWQETVFG